MDPLSDILSLLKPQSHGAGAFDVGGKLALQFPRHPGIKCYAMASGEGWLMVDGVPEPVRITAGDCFLLPSGRPFRFATDLSTPPIDAMAFITARQTANGITTVNGGGDCFIVSSHFLLSGAQANMLLGVLPPIVHIRDESDRAALRWSMDRMMQEMRVPQPGSFLVAQHLAHMMLVQALRMHLSEGANGGVGWLFALADKQMCAAMSAMHEDPAQRWTLQTLAARAGMSRSTFALKFKDTVGMSPMEYLTRWRMLLAGDRLERSGDPVSTIALSLGYESESAFSTAFKRVMGCSPRQHGRAAASRASGDRDAGRLDAVDA